MCLAFFFAFCLIQGSVTLERKITHAILPQIRTCGKHEIITTESENFSRSPKIITNRIFPSQIQCGAGKFESFAQVRFPGMMDQRMFNCLETFDKLGSSKEFHWNFPINTHTNSHKLLPLQSFVLFSRPDMQGAFLFSTIPTSDIFFYLQFFILFGAVKSSSRTDKTDYWMSNLFNLMRKEENERRKKLDIKWFWRMLNEKVCTQKEMGIDEGMT